MDRKSSSITDFLDLLDSSTYPAHPKEHSKSQDNAEELNESSTEIVCWFNVRPLGKVGLN